MGLLSPLGQFESVRGYHFKEFIMAKRQAKTDAAPVKYLHLNTESYTDVTRDSDPDDRWDADDTSTSWSLRGIMLSDVDGQHALPADFPVEIGDTVYVVYAIYSTGDSFHCADGEYLEVISFHKDRARANRNMAAANGPHASRHEMTIEFENGKKITRHCPWDGYFESLDRVDVESFVVQARDSSKPW
jgi:hypothetical protein